MIIETTRNIIFPRKDQSSIATSQETHRQIMERASERERDLVPVGADFRAREPIRFTFKSVSLSLSVCARASEIKKREREEEREERNLAEEGRSKRHFNFVQPRYELFAFGAIAPCHAIDDAFSARSLLHVYML